MLRRPTPVAYNHCPDCGLTVPLRAVYLSLEVCPRCLAHRRIARPMLLSSDGPPHTAGHGHPPAHNVPAAA
jgi:hypothetical protein